jgi:hypothetical protein
VLDIICQCACLAAAQVLLTSLPEQPSDVEDFARACAALIAFAATLTRLETAPSARPLQARARAVLQRGSARFIRGGSASALASSAVVCVTGSTIRRALAVLATVAAGKIAAQRDLRTAVRACGHGRLLAATGDGAANAAAALQHGARVAAASRPAPVLAVASRATHCAASHCVAHAHATCKAHVVVARTPAASCTLPLCSGHRPRAA